MCRFALLAVAILQGQVDAQAVSRNDSVAELTPLRERVQRMVLEDNVTTFLRELVGHEKGRPWGPEQATGPPDTLNAGDLPTAWASLSEDAQEEWLELTYAKAVIPTEVVIHETFNPGAVFKIVLMTDGDREHVVWQGKDPTAVGDDKGISRIKFDTKLRTRRIRVFLDSEEVPGWNEIDAVGLIGSETKLQWANEAEASSTYAEQPVRGRVLGFVPALGGGPQRNVGSQQKLDPQLINRVKERERQLARLIKKLRDKDSEVRRLKKTLQTSQQRINRLEEENARLRSRLAK